MFEQEKTASKDAAVSGEKERSAIVEKVAKYFLLTMVISFLGWAFETTYVYVRSGRLQDQGFMRLPFCPIYGCSVMVVYALLGIPGKPNAGGAVLLKRFRQPVVYYAAYLLFAFLIPSVAELLVGSFFDRSFHVSLWSYRAYPYNINGYVCLPVSLAWMGLIFLFMRFLFLPLKTLIFKTPRRVALVIAAVLLIATVADMTIQFFRI